MPNYELTTNTKEVLGRTLYQIRATTSFGNVSRGELGGWIEKESNLSQNGEAWVADNACVFDNAFVFGDAKVYCDAMVFEDAKIYGNALVFGDALIYGNALVYCDARVFGDTKIYGNAFVFGNALVYCDARVFEDAKIYGNAEIYGNAWVYENAEVFGDAKVYGNADVFGKLKLSMGEFFGVRYNKEEIKYVKIDDSHELICKGDIKVGGEPELEDKMVEEMIILRKAGYKPVKESK
jgi:UDP-3-O-[3-hydroxymyristoyl] glucosamine N-acyltransferase